jgi:hypothetical protein
VDNVSAIAGTVGARDDYNIANTATLSQSSFYDPVTYPAEYGNDGVPNNFMHTSNITGSTYTMTFDEDENITRIAISARDGFLNRTGNNVQLFDATNTLIDTVNLNDSYYNNLNPAAAWQGVRKIVVQDTTGGTALNFAEIEVYTAMQYGLGNVAGLGTASASTVHGSWGADPARAIDGSTDYGSSGTVFHSGNGAGGDWWQLDLDQEYTLSRVEIQARSGFNSRIGSLLEFLDEDGDTLYSEAISDGAFWAVDGFWEGIYGIKITEQDAETLNLAEVRVFALSQLATVPEPSTLGLAALSLLSLGMVGWRRRRRA